MVTSRGSSNATAKVVGESVRDETVRGIGERTESISL
jgi:hypothetical protein